MPPRSAAPRRLPISWYFDPGWFEREMLLLFEKGPGYVGHELMVPNVGDYYTLPWTEHGKVLLRGEQWVGLLSNTAGTGRAACCEGKGKRAEHRLPAATAGPTTLNGKLLGAPDFDPTPDCSLRKDGAQELARAACSRGARDRRRPTWPTSPLAADYDFSGYVFDKAIAERAATSTGRTFLADLPRAVSRRSRAPGGCRGGSTRAITEWGFGSRWSYQIMA